MVQGIRDFTGSRRIGMDRSDPTTNPSSPFLNPAIRRFGDHIIDTSDHILDSTDGLRIVRANVRLPPPSQNPFHKFFNNDHVGR